MYRKAEFLKSLKQEAKIVKHLATRIPAGQHEYRPTPAQRSTLELLQYLTFSQLASVEYLVTGSWDHYEGLMEAAKAVTPGSFAKAIDKQAAAVAKRLAKVADPAIQRKKVKHWSGTAMTLGEGLIETVLKPATAYRMQLFLYAKSSGAADLTSSDCWMGVAAKKKKAKAAQA
jgi:hypothetical protein